MQRTVLAALAMLVVSGCSFGLPWTTPHGPEGAAVQPNPTFVANTDPEYVWDTVVDVIGDEFRIEHEEPIRVLDGVITEGRLDTYSYSSANPSANAQPSATLLEPWRRDSASAYDRLESTLQSMQRKVSVRVTPGNGGFWIEVVAFKELENLAQPAYASAGAATFHYDTSLTRITNPVGEQPETAGWIPQGRDANLEQYFIYHLQSRFAGIGVPNTPRRRDSPM
jgi:hypothetical protein